MRLRHHARMAPRRRICGLWQPLQRQGAMQHVSTRCPASGLFCHAERTAQLWRSLKHIKLSTPPLEAEVLCCAAK